MLIYCLLPTYYNKLVNKFMILLARALSNYRIDNGLMYPIWILIESISMEIKEISNKH